MFCSDLPVKQLLCSLAQAEWDAEWCPYSKHRGTSGREAVMVGVCEDGMSWA